MVSLFCARSRAVIAAMLVGALPAVSQFATLNYIEMEVTGTFVEQVPLGMQSDPRLSNLFGSQFTWRFTSSGPYYAAFPLVFGNSTFELDGEEFDTGKEYKAEDVIGRPYWNYPGTETYSYFRSPPDRPAFKVSISNRLSTDGGLSRVLVRLNLGYATGGYDLRWRGTHSTFGPLEASKFENSTVAATVLMFDPTINQFTSGYAVATVDSLSLNTPHGILAPVPVPASAPLLLLAMAGLIAFRRRSPV